MSHIQNERAMEWREERLQEEAEERRAQLLRDINNHWERQLSYYDNE